MKKKMKKIFFKYFFQKMITNEAQECEIPSQPFQIRATKIKECMKPKCALKKKCKVNVIPDKM